ncbi:unnamed protein product [Lupinus luteus]|uniref:Nuclear receptor corepressor 1 n=1 Tax=Lupinus luteus TaxID=3873 RepID=A0AAV1W1F5_LUPLU
MPPEPIPWDRKEFFKERKHERSESLGSAARWRDSSYHHGSRDFNRWGSADFRRPAGHGKQGGWHLLPEESGRGYSYSRSCDKMLDDDNCRPVVSRDGKYHRSIKENRGSFGQRDWRERSWEASNGSQNFSTRQLDANNDQKSAVDMLTYSSRPHADFVNTWEQHHLEDQHDKMGGLNGLGTGRRCDKESSLGSIDWKPLKWTRSGSLSSRGSGFSHSSSTRSFRVTNSYEGKAELPHKNASAIESHSGEAAACVTSSVPSEETDLRKKPRLKWGEGLAKFEKKKVEGPDESSSKNDPILSISNLEPCNALCPSVVDKSPKVIGFSGCASPATLSSVACSSSPGVNDKLFVKAANVDNDVSNLEKLDTDSLTSLGSSLNELLRFDDLSSVDSSLVRSTSTAMNKLLIWKADVSKVLEVTETEIDSLENELKSLKSKSEGRFPCPAAAGSLLVCYNAKPCEGHVGGTNRVARPKPVQIVSSVDPNMEKMLFSTNLHTIHDNGKEEDIGSPGTATSKFIEPPSLINAVSLCDVGRNDTCAADLDVVQSTDMQCLVPCSQRQVASVSAHGDDSTMEGGMDANTGASLSSITGEILYNTILSSNKECANRAYEVFAKLLPKQCAKIGNVEASSGSHDSSFMERFAAKKQYARFKERVITLKFKALHHLWKEDMCILSIKKYRPKSHKKVELGVRTVNSGQKNRSSIRSRFPLPGNLLSLVPKSEIVNFASKVLSESKVKVHRNSLKMPALILDQKEKMVSKFISTNGLVEDPLAIEKERAMINPWTSEETDIFQEKFANFGKDFRKIATFLDHKTTADCVEFYYKNHKSDCFEKIKKQYGGKLGNSFSVKTNLMASDKRWNCEVNAASLDILSAASEMADSIPVNQKMRSGSLLLRGLGRVKSSRGKDSITERSNGFDILHDERVSVAADVLAGICGSLSSEAISSCTSLVDPVEGNRNLKCVRLSPLCQQPEIPDVTQDMDDVIFSDEGCEEMDPTDWTDEEKALFLQAVSSFGKDYAMIAQYVGTRSQSQCKVFFSKARKCLGLDLMHRRPENSGSPLNGHANGGGSDTDDACVVETGSANGSDKSGTKTDEELHSSVLNSYCDVSCHMEASNMSTDLNESKKVNGAEVHHEHVNMVSDAFIIEGKTKLANDGNAIILHSSDASGSVLGQKAIIISDSTEVGKDKKEVEGATSELASATEIIEPYHCNSVAEVFSSMGNENELEGRRMLSPQFLVERDDKHEADTGALACSRLSFDVESQPQLSMEKPHISGLSVESPHAATNSLLQNATTPSPYEKIASQDQLSSTCYFQGSGDNYCHNSISNVDHQLHNPGGLLEHAEAATTSQCYSLQVPVNKEVNVDTSCSGSSKKLPLLTQKIEQADDHCKTELQCLLDSEKISRNGDVKLFGKILTIPSSTQKPNLTTKGSEENDTHYPLLSSNSSNLNFTGHHIADGKSAVLKFGHNDHTEGLENVPVISYGYWDGNRIQTGFKALSDSAILLAKYPAAFSNYPEASATSEQQSLKASAKSNEQHLNGAFTTRKVNCNNGVVDYEMCRNSDGPIVKPFMVDVKLHQDVFSEMQKRNGVGEPGTLVEGGVSDPVAAIKMHYSNYSDQSGSITREDECWGGKEEAGSSRCSV